MTGVAPAAIALVPRMVPETGDLTTNALAFLRNHLDMDMAFLSEIKGHQMELRAVDAPGFEHLASVGDLLDLDDVYCLHILEGRLPELIRDTNDIPLCQTIAITSRVNVRAHVSVPIWRTDQSVFGMFCILGRAPRLSLNNRDLEVVKAFAALVADDVNVTLDGEEQTIAKRRTITQILETGGFDISLQPIQCLRDQTIAGYEALCRFNPVPYRPPNVWFQDAADVGLQLQLELDVIERAFALLPDLPGDCYLSVNTSAGTLASGRIASLVPDRDGRNIIMEITEHAAIEDLDVLLMEIDRLRDMGVRIAIDDAGAGYSGLQQIIRLRPDVIKLDMSLTQNVDQDVARRSLASAMVKFAADTKAKVVAEGIETEAERQTLRRIGVELGQGYHLGRPTPAREVLKTLKSA
ncbi:EAL domain-containing protein [Pseudooctadecabacter sp.]|uniref:sensor domain-containing phosphodiesterase n=1 Tax=Pseudooctadecabacter sp. TaxID=1966338 RepID=UPI0025F48DFB|nr:EAL domain-containing protein [Pseudooctadecabacter sp.]